MTILASEMQNDLQNRVLCNLTEICFDPEVSASAPLDWANHPSAHVHTADWVGIVCSLNETFCTKSLCASTTGLKGKVY